MEAGDGIVELVAYHTCAVVVSTAPKMDPRCTQSRWQPVEKGETAVQDS